MMGLAVTYAWLLVGRMSEPTLGEQLNLDPTSRDILIYLCDGNECPAITDGQQRALEARLGGDPVVDSFSYVSQEQAFARFQEVFEDQPELLETITIDALPSTFSVTLVEGADPLAFRDAYGGSPGVEDVFAEASFFESEGTN